MKTRQTWLLALVCLVPAAAASADPRSDEVLKKFREVTAKSQTLQAELVMTTQSPGETRTLNYTLRLMKPNFAQIRITDASGEKRGAIMSNGKELFVVTDEVKRYQTAAADPRGSDLGGIGGLHSPITAFFNPDQLLRGTTHRFVGQQSVGGKVLTSIEVVGQRAPQSQRLFFDGAGHLEAVEVRYTDPKGPRIVTTTLRNQRYGGDLTAASFAYSPPAGYRPYKTQSFEDTLLAVGKPAPDFTAPRVDSGTLQFSETRKDKKATLLYFWFQGAPSSVKELGELQKLYAEHQARGFEIVAVNWSTPAETVKRLVAEQKTTFPVVLSGEAEKVSQKYQVLGYPTYYLLDSTGKIVWRATGEDHAELVKQLAKLGF